MCICYVCGGAGRRKKRYLGAGTQTQAFWKSREHS